MEYFFPDSQDFIDPNYDFVRERPGAGRIRQRTDAYPHEVFPEPPYDGMLVSKAVVEGIGGGAGKYTASQWRRFTTVGVREYLRINNPALRVMGDCGAFSYVREETPPFRPEEVAKFYADCGFDLGLSVDHIILGYRPDAGEGGAANVDPAWKDRQQLTLTYAAQFLNEHAKRNYVFTPIGVAQGWSPESYSLAVRELQALGYTYIAMGGFVPLKTPEILQVLKRVNEDRKPQTKLHLLGITRCENVEDFRAFGAVSFDSTSHFRRAFKDELNNYYVESRTYSAVRVPQVEKNPALLRQITAGRINQTTAMRLESECLSSLRLYDSGRLDLDSLLGVLREYEQLHDGKYDRTDRYREVLRDKPWKSCPCWACQTSGIEVIVFRGAERNRRRGYHNLYMFYHHLRHEHSKTLTTSRTLAGVA